MDEKELYSNQQHNLRSRHSCLSQVIDSLQKRFELLNKGKIVDVVYADFEKAFD